MLRSRSYLGSVLRASVLRYLHSVVGCVSGIREGQAVVTYSATRDWWVTLLLWGTTLAIAAAVVYSVHKEEMDSMAHGIYLALTGTIVLCLVPLYALSYTLSDRDLRVGFGPVGMRVPLNTIESVTLGSGQGLAWSWSMSLKGLVIARRGKSMDVAISPQDQDGFLRDLAARCSHLELHDDGLVARE